MHEDRAGRFAHGEPGVAHRVVRRALREPRRRHETDRRKTERTQSRDPAVDPGPRRAVVEGQKLPLLVGAPECPQFILPSTREPNFIVPLAVQKNLRPVGRAVGGAVAQPLHERRITLDRRTAVPVGNDVQPGDDTALGTQRPERLHPLLQRGRDVMDRDEQRGGLSHDRPR